MVEVYPPGLVTSTRSWSARFSFQPAVVNFCHAAVMYSVGIGVGKKIGLRLATTGNFYDYSSFLLEQSGHPIHPLGWLFCCSFFFLFLVHASANERFLRIVIEKEMRTAITTVIGRKAPSEKCCKHNRSCRFKNKSCEAKTHKV